MKSALAVVLVAALAAAAKAAPAAQEDPSDDIKLFKKPLLGDFKTYQRPAPLDGSLEDGTWERLEGIRLFEQGQGLGGAFDWAVAAPFAPQGPWGDAPALAHAQAEGRHKREVCMWLGQKACALKCKFFGRGATQGRCTYGYCECYYPQSYPGITG